MELKLNLVTTSPDGWWVGGCTKTKFMLFSTQVEVVVELKLELSLAKSCNDACAPISVFFCPPICLPYLAFREGLRLESGMETF